MFLESGQSNKSVDTNVKMGPAKGAYPSAQNQYMQEKLEAPKGHPSKGHRWKSKILVKF